MPTPSPDALIERVQRAGRQHRAPRRFDQRPARGRGPALGVWSTNKLMRTAERELAEQAEASYRRMVTDQQAGAPARKAGASVTLERA